MANAASEHGAWETPSKPKISTCVWRNVDAQAGESKLPSWEPGTGVATRVACVDVLNAIVDVVPGLVGGGADLTGNTGTQLKSPVVLSRDDFTGRQIYFGIREHAMGSAMNGMALHGGLLPFGTLPCSAITCARRAPAALSRAKVLFVLVTRRVGLGEDGPTHQPVEHVTSLRAIPGLRVIRPADANETAQAWRLHIEGDGPPLTVTRQKVPVLEGSAERCVSGMAQGAYVLVDEPTGREPDVVLIGTGSEVSLCVDAAALLADTGVAAQVVSMPSWDLFDAASDAARWSVLPPGIPTLAVEAGIGLGWDRDRGRCCGD